MKTHINLWTYNDMVLAESIHDIIRANLTRVSFTEHALERMKRWRVNKGQVLKTLAQGRLIEAHDDAGVLRFLFRRTPNNATKSICVVVDARFHVITVYCNHASDNHTTLDLTAYNCTLVELLGHH